MDGELATLGSPDLEIAGMRLWVHGRQFPRATDYWDGNWLRVTAYCVYPDAMVRTHGSIVHLGELVGLLRGCERVHRTLKGEASLECIEPNLNVSLKIQWNGTIDVHIEITPDHMTERHTFDDSLDQSHLPSIIGQCGAILEAYPVRQPESLPGSSAA
jgi:hypothetical protein